VSRVHSGSSAVTPRRTTLLRAPDLRSFQRAIADASFPDADPVRLRDCAVIVPTRAAGELLRRALERLRLGDGRRVTAVPEIVTREDWYTRLHERLGASPPLLTAFDREVLLRAAACAAADAGAAPPFRLRPGLVVEMLSFYDELLRRDRTLEAFERLMVESLEPSAEIDRGAARLLAQTRFLAAAFREYETRVAATGRLDEHGLRRLARSAPARHPFRHVVLTVADRIAEPSGLWHADFDLLARLPGLERVDVVTTEQVLASGFHQRVHDLLPGIDERLVPSAGAAPALVIPPEAEPRHFVARDREEELVEAARLVKRRARGGSLRAAERLGIVFQRPLPYLYLARHVFADARIEWQASDALPLGAEPYAAAVDLVLTFAGSGFSRAAGIALLRSPHFAFGGGPDPRLSRAVAALNRALLEARFLGGVAALESIAERMAGAPAQAARSLVAAARELAPLTSASSASGQIRALLVFLRGHERLVPPEDPLFARHVRARGATLGALEGLADAHARYDDRPFSLEELTGTIRRWIESQTFSPRTGAGGVQLADATAARYGDFDEIRIVGLVEPDWPERPARGIFYPAALLNQLGWVPEAQRLAGARAAFRDLLRLPARRVSASAFTLEDEALVPPSTFIEELDAPDLMAVRDDAPLPARMFVHEALADDPLEPSAVTGAPADWLAARRARTPACDARFRGLAGATSSDGYAVAAVEQYLACPFKYFAGSVLDLEEEKDDEPGLTPLERGRFVHEVLCEFFTEWQRRGGGAITIENMPEAIAAFTRIAEARLATVPDTDRALERTHLLGSAAAPGLAERAFAFELERPVPVVERLLEHRLEGEFTFRSGGTARVIRLRGKADRIDILANGAIRVIDYKLRKAPRPARALQLPVYGVAATQALAAARGGEWRLAEAGYVAFAERQAFVRLGGRQGNGEKHAEAVAAGQALFIETIDAIERGEFPVRPDEPYMCRFCAYPSVCRKDYVGDE
jgi:RecB family exonuclease